MGKFVAIAAVMFVLALSPVAFSEDSDAAGGDGMVFYCYGDHPRLDYEYTILDGMRIEWSVTGPDGPLGFSEFDGGKHIVVDLTDVPREERVTVVQEVYYNDVRRDTATMGLIPLHIGGDTYDVVFMDGSSEFSRMQIDRRTLVIQGQDHVVLPAPPVKDGYEFDGWYTDRSFSERFDPKMPVSGDMTVHARWIGSGSGGHTTTVVIDDTHVVTFETVTGIEYKVVGQDSRTIRFTVGVVGGYDLVDGTLSVTSDRGTITVSDGVYMLSGIESNIVVSISGEVSPVSPDDPVTPTVPEDDGFPWWVAIIILLALMVAMFVVKSIRDRKG